MKGRKKVFQSSNCIKGIGGDVYNSNNLNSKETYVAHQQLLLLDDI